MQAVIRDLSEISTSVAIASSIWLMRKKKRWARFRAAWVQRRQGGLPQGTAVPSGSPAPILAPCRLAAPASTAAAPPFWPVLRANGAHAAHAHAAPLEHIEVVEDSDWQVWEAALASQRGHGGAA